MDQSLPLVFQFQLYKLTKSVDVVLGAAGCTEIRRRPHSFLVIQQLILKLGQLDKTDNHHRLENDGWTFNKKLARLISSLDLICTYGTSFMIKRFKSIASWTFM